MTCLPSLALAPLALCASLSAAAAQDTARKIDFTQPLLSPLSPTHEPYRTCLEQAQDGSCRRDGVLTLGLLAASALSAAERGLGIDEQVRRGLLAIRIVNNAQAELTAEEIGLIKKQIGALGINTVEATVAVGLLDPAALRR